MIYSAFFRGKHDEDGVMIRVEADTLPEAAKIAEETRSEHFIPDDLDLHLVVQGYGSPRMF